MKPVKRTPPFPTGREPGGYKYVCRKCGTVVDLIIGCVMAGSLVVIALALFVICLRI